MLKTCLKKPFICFALKVNDFFKEFACLLLFATMIAAPNLAFAQVEIRCEGVFDEASKAYFSSQAEDHAALILHLIKNEKKAIRMAYYQCDGNKVGQVLFSYLRDAARRGVQVELLLDAWNPDDWIDTPVKIATLEALAAEGVQVRYFNDVDRSSPWARFLAFLRPTNFNRMHDKLAIFQSQSMVVTGDRMPQNMNFRVQLTKGTAKRDENGKVVSRFSYLSVMAAVQSQGAVRDSVRYFDQMFQLGSARDVSSVSEASVAKQNKHWDKVVDIIETKDFHDLAPQILEKMTPIDGVQFISDVPGKKWYGAYKRGISKDILQLLASAKSSITIFSPYMNFTEPFLKVLRQARRNKIQVTLIVPSWDSIDTPFTLENWEPQARYLQNLGVEIYQHSGPDFMHAKIAEVDGVAAYAGSFNFNPRSTFMDHESGVIVWDPEFVASVLAFKSYIIQENSTPYQPRPSGVKDRIQLSLLRKLMQWNLLIRRQI